MKIPINPQLGVGPPQHRWRANWIDWLILPFYLVLSRSRDGLRTRPKLRPTHSTKFILLWLLMGWVSFGYAQTDFCLADTKLLAYWPFDGNANDASAHSYDGEEANKPQSTTGKFGNPDSAYRFYKKENGNIKGGHFKVPSFKGFDFSKLDGFSFSAWIYQTRVNNQHSGAILSKRGENNGFLFAIQGKRDGNTHPEQQHLKYRPFDTTDDVMWSDDAISLNQWYHVVFTYDGSTGKMYIDGDPNGSQSLPPPTNAKKKALFIGKESAKSQPKHYWFGKLDEVRIYGCALSDKEVKKLRTLNPDNPLPPIPRFKMTPEIGGEAPLTVTLDASRSEDQDGSIVNYKWLIDGKTLYGQKLTTTLSEHGTHSIVLIVTDDKGLPGFTTKTAKVLPPNQPPVAAFIVEPSSGEVPLTVTLDGSPSLDPDPDGSIVSYNWSINGQTLSGKTAQITFDEPGSYPITLTVTDNKGDESKPVERIVKVEPLNEPPVPEFTITPPSGKVPLSVTVDASQSTDDGTIVNYAWSTSTGKTASGKQADFSFETGGTHKVKLTVTDDKGKSATLEKTVEVLKKTIRLKVVDSPDNVKPGESFDITLQFEPGPEEPVDGIEVYLEFDPAKLQVNSVTNSGVLDFELKNEIGNNYIDFAAVSFDNEVPTELFDLVTINFTALEETGDSPTFLEFVPEKTLFTSQGEYISQDYDEHIPILIGEEITQPALGCNVKQKVHVDTPPVNVNWETELTIYCSSTDGKKCGVTAKVDNAGVCTIEGSIPPDTEFICVKGSNTLANRVKGPFSEPVDFGSLLAGDTNDDGSVDFRDLGDLKHKNADFNADGSIDDVDMALATANLDRPKEKDYDDGKGPLCENYGDANNPRYRRGQRNGSKPGVITLHTTPIPTYLAVGDSFDMAIRVDTNIINSVDGVAAHLNFDPALLQVNQLTPGHRLDFVLKNHFDNTQGQIDYAAVLFGNDIPTDTFTVVVINFTLLGEGGEQTLAFNTTSPRETVATFAGEYVNASVQDDWIVFDEAPMEYVISNYLFDKSANPIAGVQVQIGDQTVTTDANGHWKIKVREGVHTITAQKEGITFEPVECVLTRQQIDCPSLEPNSMLDIRVTPSTRQVELGGEVTYTVTVINKGNRTATNLVIADSLPLGTGLVSIGPIPDGNCDNSSVSCTLPHLKPGEKATLDIVVSNYDQLERLINTVTVTSDQYAPEERQSWADAKPHLSVQ
jgi:uncharacterized repeat protein (TIGR01451 family)